MMLVNDSSDGNIDDFDNADNNNINSIFWMQLHCGYHKLDNRRRMH